MKSFGVHIVEGLGYVLVKLGRLNDKSVIMATKRNWYMTHCVETRNPYFYIEEHNIQRNIYLCIMYFIVFSYR